MGISKIVTNTVKVAIKTSNVPAQATQKVANVAKNAVKKTMPELQLAEDAVYHSFSPEIKEIVKKIRDAYWQFYSKNNRLDTFSSIDTWINGLLRYGDDEKKIVTILINQKALNRYIKIKSHINKNFAKVTPSNDRFSVSTNLTLMAMFNKNSFKALAKSKGMREIEAGRLNVSYLKNIKSTDKIDENFFYNLFDNIEKQTNKRLASSGLDVDAVNKYLKLADEQVCRDPKFADNLISELEKIKDPELANKIMRKWGVDSRISENYNDDLRKVISFAQSKPEIIEKLTQLEISSPGSVSRLSTKMADEKIWNVSDDLFSTYVKFEKANPKQCYPMTIDGINKFLGVKNVDENLVKSIFASQNLTKEIGPTRFDEIFCRANEKNLDILKSCIEKGKFTEKDWVAYILKGNHDVTDETILKLYKETYKPLKTVLKDTNYGNYIPEDMVEFRLSNPEKYQKLVDSKILDLVKEKKISPRILENYRGDYMPEIYSDVQKLLNGESLIKKFDSTKDILQKTTAGDVVSIKGKMYINNNGKLEPWEMTEEKFNDLFPLVDRFSTRQGYQDCYFITVLNSLYQNPRTRGEYYKLFKQKGEDIFVTIPAYKDYFGTVKFPKGNIETSLNNADAAKNVQMLERAYARTALRTIDSTPICKNPLTTNDLNYLQNRIVSGHPMNVFKELSPFGLPNYQKLIRNKESIVSALENYGQNPRYLIIRDFVVKGRNAGHATSIKSYDPKSKILTITDPEKAGVQEKKSLEDFLSDVWDIVVTRVG